MGLSVPCLAHVSWNRTVILDSAKVIIEVVIPVNEPSIAGQGMAQPHGRWNNHSSSISETATGVTIFKLS